MTPIREPVYPPLNGSVIIPDVVDFNLKNNPEQPYFVYASDDTSSHEVTEITHLEFARAAHRVAHALRPCRSGPDGQVVGIIAVTDTILYCAIVLGTIKAGLVPFPISPRNSPAAIVSLLRSTSCHRLVITETTLNLVNNVKSEFATCTASDFQSFDLTVDRIPSLDDVYPNLGIETASDPFEPYQPYESRPQLDDVALYLHSSGSTGFPKAIPVIHGTLLHWSSFLTDLRDHAPPLRIGTMASPPFHTFGIHLQLLHPLFGVRSVSVYPPLATKSKIAVPIIPTPANILDHMQRTNSNSLMIIPAFLQTWAESQEAIDYLKTLEVVWYAGGAIAPKIRKKLLRAGVIIHTVYGGTEFGAPTVMNPLDNDMDDGWSWMRFREQVTMRWNPQGDGTYECQFLTTDIRHLAVENLPDVKGYATSDVFEKHPTKEGLWRVIGRADDVIIHSSGEKTVPGPMEGIITSSPIVQGAVMFGREHSQVGILIELTAGLEFDLRDQEQLAALRNKLWPMIEEANHDAPAFSRIFREMILFTSPHKPMARAGKGTVMRKATLHGYREQIEALYEAVESNSTASEAIVLPKDWTVSELQLWLLKQATDIQSRKVISPIMDLFEQGFDSLSATFLRRRIVSALRSSGDAVIEKAADEVMQTIVYTNSSIERLSVFLVELVTKSTTIKSAADGKALIEQMIAKYSSDMKRATSKQATKGQSTTGAVVLLTGSTGSLGSHILASLLENSATKRVYAFNRPSSGRHSVAQRHKARFEDGGLDTALLRSEKLIYIEADATQSRLGMDQELYEELQRSVTLIIHNAWKLDFNLALPSFESNICGTRNLIDLALTATHVATTRFLFTSSVASAQSWNKELGPFPEEVLADAGVAVGNGYGEGKYVAERLLAHSGLQATSLRIGQICGGPPKGTWSKTDWVPIMVKSSLALGGLPHIQGVVSWLLLPAVSKIILDIAFAEEQLPLALNLVHPRPVEWRSVIAPMSGAISQCMNLGPTGLPLMPFREWLSRLEDRARDRDLTNVPAVKLLEFFRGLVHDDVVQDTGIQGNEVGGLPIFSTEKARYISSTMNELEPIGAQEAHLWVGYWNSIRLFNWNIDVFEGWRLDTGYGSLSSVAICHAPNSPQNDS